MIKECHLGMIYCNLQFNNPFLNEIEIGFDFDFKLEYYHTWHDYQVHCLSIGNIYVYWKGHPILDNK
jgi:hypothetical protein